MRRAIYTSVQFLNITKSWCFPIPCFLIVTSLTQNLSRKIVSYTSRTNGNKSIKITICRNFEANILTSKYKFHKFWNFNPSCDRTIVKIWKKKAQICIPCAKSDSRMSKWNQTDISNTVCSRNIKTRSI